MFIRHRQHSHEVDLDGDEIIEIDGRECEKGYVTRARNGELICCLPPAVCDED